MARPRNTPPEPDTDEKAPGPADVAEVQARPVDAAELDGMLVGIQQTLEQLVPALAELERRAAHNIDAIRKKVDAVDERLAKLEAISGFTEAQSISDQIGALEEKLRTIATSTSRAIGYDVLQGVVLGVQSPRLPE